ncbi:ribonuclease Z [Paenibacillus sp. KQZ6P-2]|uniref:Ribonuclease Z n=1 Tax=Paenibacillus mangrovi TaxID=2931978 RepID=A0A9X1WNK5_9BACL|nr:ribonuclease Z [Paenibacillus mangrovi]MCJ8012547.1 ribonuclease Z [Paenibacillus mangrovi]
MELEFLGTNAGVPSLQRNVTSMALRMFEERRSFWLFDCGEATQHQILRSSLKLSKLEKVFITHLHGDHIFGLPGLLSSRAYQGGTTKLTVYGPPGLKQFIEVSLTLSQSRIEYELEIIEHTGGTVYEDQDITVESLLLDHRVDSYGYRIAEKDKAGSLDLKRLAECGLKPGPAYGRLKRGESIELGNGQILKPEDVLGSPKKGRVVTILGDTRPCDNVVTLARDADLLVHEATFMGDMKESAYNYHHSTSIQAAEAAVKAGAKELILTHFSSRYKDLEHLQPMLEEAKTIFPNTMLAEELVLFPVHRHT